MLRATLAPVRSLIRLTALLALTSCTESEPRAVPDASADAAGVPEPTCCGCLCADAHWSCSADTCTQGGLVRSLAAEAGFLEVPVFVQAPGVPPPNMAEPDARAVSARVWYSFFPADATPEAKPLLLLMQGGPGSSVLPLWGGNTGPRTLDPRRASEGGTADNPLRWTRFANLLYLDTPYAGFSYQTSTSSVGPSSGCDRPFDPDEEAASYVRALLRFLARHPALQAAPVALVGESYGGVRAQMMLQQLRHPERLRDLSAIYHDPALADEVAEHVRRLADQRGEEEAGDPGRQFWAQILIQPVVLGGRTSRPTGACTWPEGKAQGAYESELVLGMMGALRDVAELSRFIGVDAKTIRWLHADQRSSVCDRNKFVYREPPDPQSLPPDLPWSDIFGTLAPGDRFYVRATALPAADSERLPSGDRVIPQLASLFVDNLRELATFITDAPCDGVVSGEELLSRLAELPGIAGVARDEAAEGRAFLVRWDDGEQRALRMPIYAESGHMVTVHAPEQIAPDVEQFIRDTLPARAR
jgi:hypothetical protein